MIVAQEYNALRNEILSRYTGQLQSTVALVGVLGALVTFGLTHDFTGIVRWMLASGAFWLVIQILIAIDILRLSSQLRAIEERINALAGETLLSWETQRGLRGFMRIVNYLKRWLPLSRRPTTRPPLH